MRSKITCLSHFNQFNIKLDGDFSEIEIKVSNEHERNTQIKNTEKRK